jgi:serine/threonine protein kinase/Tfp pilus assembly protein PilF
MGDENKTLQCPQCHTPIADDSRFCNRCGHYVVDKADTLTYTPPLEKILDDHLGFSPGDSFGPRYRIIEEIGRGGMGRVYKAKDQELDITVALKMIRSAFSSNPRFIQRFKEETLLSRSISHENVIRIHDMGDVDEIKFISMDYIKGHDLKELIHTSGTLSIQTAINITKQICKGLKAAHQKNIIHLDLKPRNIMIDSDGKVFIMDFGVARSLGSQEAVQEKKLIGTPAYISPEQAKSEGVDKRSDIYSLGIILFEMLLGKRPFEADTLDDYVDMHIHKKPPHPSDIRPQIPPFLGDIVLKCLKKDKNKRYQDVEELLKDLKAHEDESQTYIPQIKAKKLRSLLYFVPVVLLIAIGLYMFIGKMRPNPPYLTDAGKIPLVVMFFENHTGDQDLDEWRMGLSYLIISDLQQSNLIKVLPSDSLFSVLENLNLIDEKNYSAEDLKRVTIRGGSNHLLYGHYTKADDVYRIDVVLKNVLSDELTTRRFEGNGEITFFNTADNLTQWIKSQLNIGSAEIAADSDKNIRDIFTDSPEALKFYIQGKHQYYLGDFQKSNEILEKAVKIDDGFALAFRQISENYHYLGKIDRAQKYATTALSMKDKVSIRDGYLLEGWANTILEESYKNAENIYLEMIQKYPDDEDANIYLGAIYRNMEKWVLAQERFEKILTVNPLLSIDNILLFYRAKGQYEKAHVFIETNKNELLEITDYHFYKGISHFYQKNYDNSRLEFEKALSISPDFLDVKEMLGHLFLIQDDFVQAENYYRTLIESERLTYRFYGKLWLFSLRIAQGRYVECKNEIIEEILNAEKNQQNSNKLSFLNLLAYVNLRMGQLEKALEATEQAQQIATDLKFHFDKIIAIRLHGVILIRMDKIEEAKKIASSLKSYLDRIEIPKYNRYYNHLEGLIAQHENSDSVAVGNFNKAISLLSYQYESLNDHAFYFYSLAMAYYQMNNFEQAQQQFENIIGLTSGRFQWGDLYAKSYYWLGKIYQREDRQQEGIRNYQKFLNLWKDADSGFPEMEDARKQLAILENKSTE